MSNAFYLLGGKLENTYNFFSIGMYDANQIFGYHHLLKVVNEILDKNDYVFAIANNEEEKYSIFVDFDEQYNDEEFMEIIEKINNHLCEHFSK